MEKRYLPMWMWLCAGKLKVKTADFRLPSASQKSACLSSLTFGLLELTSKFYIHQLRTSAIVSNIFFTTIATDLAIWLANLPLSIRVQTTLLTSMCHAMPFSARALAKTISLLVVIVVKKQVNVVYRCLYSYLIAPRESITFWLLWWPALVVGKSTHVLITSSFHWKVKCCEWSLYVEDVFMSFRKYWRWMSQHEH